MKNNDENKKITIKESIILINITICIILPIIIFFGWIESNAEARKYNQENTQIKKIIIETSNIR